MAIKKNKEIEHLDFEGLEYYDEKLKKWVEENGGGVSWGRIKSKPDPTIIRLNQAISNPSSMLSGEFGKDGTPKTNVISWIRANSHRYVGNYDAEQGMVLRQLDDNNSELYADGSDASQDIQGLNGGDVFMKMPDFWFKGEPTTDNNNIVDIHITVTDPQDDSFVKWDGNTLIGAYKALAENKTNNNVGGVFSRSNYTPNLSISAPNYKAKARNRSNENDHFQLVTYEAHKVMALLYMCWYGDMNSQKMVGYGTTSYPKVTGASNQDGMNDTVSENTRSINFWGLENWWGDVYEIVDNMETYNTTGALSLLDYDGTEIERIQIPSTMVSTNSKIIGKMLLGSKLDVLIKADNTSGIDYSYCDRAQVNPTKGQVMQRSYMMNDSNGGVYSHFISLSKETAMYSAGTRLLYHGRVTVLKNAPIATSSMRKARAINTWKPIDLQYVYRNGTPVLRTGFDFNVLNVSELSQVGQLSLYGLNINYDEIAFENNALTSDKDGKLTFNTDTLPQSVDMMYEDKLIGTLKFYDITEEELIERQQKEMERQMNEQNA